MKRTYKPPVKVIVTTTDEPMPQAQFDAWVKTMLRVNLEHNGIEATTDNQIGLGFWRLTAMDTIYINRGDQGFERYAGTRETLAMVGWPSIFPERFKSNQPVSVAPAKRYLHTNERNGLNLVSMEDPDEGMWAALERHIAASEQVP